MPKKSRRGGAGGGGGRTEEERLLLLQQRAQAEEETKRKKEEILTLFLRDKLQKEQRNSCVNLLKLNDGWRSMLRLARVARLRDDVTVMSQTFERTLDGLDSVVKTLQRDLQEAELQSAQVRRLHLQQLERLMAQQDRRVQLVQEQWETLLTHLSSGFKRDREQVLSQVQQQREALQDAGFTERQRHRGDLDQIHKRYQDCIKSYESALQDRRNFLLMQTKEPLEQELLLHQEAQRNMNQVKELLEATETKNMVDTWTMMEDVEHVTKLQDLVTRLHLENSSPQSSSLQSQVQDLTLARDQVQLQTRVLRDQLTQSQVMTRRRLTELTVQSSATSKKLQEVIAKGQSLLRVAESCQKLQDQMDLSFTGGDQEASGLQLVSWCLQGAVLQREALRRRRDNQCRENERLRFLLRQRLDTMTVSDHALLTVSHAPSTTSTTTSITTAAAEPAAATRRRHVVVIEAAHVAKHSL